MMKYFVNILQPFCFPVGISERRKFEVLPRSILTVPSPLSLLFSLFPSLSPTSVPHLRAMGGSVLFQDALKGRLDLIKPSRADIQNCLLRHPATLSPG